MKKIILCLALCAVIIATASCANGSTAPSETDTDVKTTQTAPVTDAESAAADETDAAPDVLPEELYFVVIEKYKSAVREKWDFEMLDGQGMSVMCAQSYETGIGYMFSDLDGDGVYELVIGQMGVDTPLLLDVYTYENGAPVQLVCCRERSSFYLCTDNVIENIGSDGAFLCGWVFSKLENGALATVEAVQYDKMNYPDSPWFTSHDGDFDASNDTPSNETDARSIIDGYEGTRTAQDYTKIS